MTSTGWSELMATALVGTSRRPWTAVGSPLMPAGGPAGEAGLLTSAGAVALARRAGAPAVTGIAVPPPAPAEPRPLASPAALVRLEGLLANDDEEHLGLWLKLAVRHGRAVPGRMLPELFRRARQHTSVRADLTVVVGARGAWLAAQRDDWRPLLGDAPLAEDGPPPDAESWSHGTPAERLAYLARVRRDDADRARELLAEAWPTEAPADRAALLAVLADGIGPADEELCEKARVDPRVAVRRQAVTLLARIRASAYLRRMAERALSYVAVVDGAIAVTPPAAIDTEMKRDDIDPKPPAGTGERAWWAEQVIAATPLSVWTALAGEVPAGGAGRASGGASAAGRGGQAGADAAAALVGRPVADGWGPVLHRAWGRAAVAQRDAAWATALLAAGYGRGDSVDIVDAGVAASLHDLLDPATALAWTHEMLARPASNLTDLARLLAASPQPLPRELIRPLLHHLRDHAIANRSYYVSPRLRELAAVVSAGLPLDAVAEVIRAADEIRAAADDQQHAVVAVIDTVTSYVTTRHSMIQEFS